MNLFITIGLLAALALSVATIAGVGGQNNAVFAVATDDKEAGRTAGCDGDPHSGPTKDGGNPHHAPVDDGNPHFCPPNP